VFSTFNKITKQKEKIINPSFEDMLYSTIRIIDPELLDGIKKQYRFCTGEYAKRKFKFDFCWPELKLAVEVDGGQWQAGGGKHMSDADYDKLNIAAAHGYFVVRFKTNMVRDDGVGCVMRIREVYDNLCKK
jgi:very-short-patch-repair endonuclease